MISIINCSKKSKSLLLLYNMTIKCLFIAFIMTGIQASLQAQEVQFTRPSWWFGIAGGGNINFYRGSTQTLNDGLTVPTSFHNGTGLGLYVAPLIEFHPPTSRWGVMLQAGYDNRKGKLKEVTTPCNCPEDLSADISYITVEPSLRFAPFKSNFYLYGGPRLAINVSKSFSYQMGTNPDVPGQATHPEVNGDLSHVDKTLLSLQIGAGYDIQLSPLTRSTQFVLSPFVSFQPYFGQSPRSIETLNITTLRVGAALKFGHGHLKDVSKKTIAIIPAAVVEETPVLFSVNSPKNIPTERKIRETFPLRNYIFFNKGSTQIPDRYVLLSKSQGKDFKENQPEAFSTTKTSGRSSREMVVYYNILNILGDRMVKNPAATIMLVGSADEGPKEGRDMAESIKHYLVDIFEIDPVRIKIEGRYKPKIPSEQPGGTLELGLLREGDRRVSIESSSPALLMEFQTSPNAPLKPVEILAVQEAPLDSYVLFNANGAKNSFSSWSLEITDNKGIVQYFGPYIEDSVNLPGKTILGTRSEGDFKVVMIGRTKSGKTIKQNSDLHVALWTPSTDEEGMRFSVIFEFNNAKAIKMYEKYISEIITPKIPIGGTVIIHGHTDIIGDEVHNQELSLARANDVKDIIARSLKKTGRSDVKFTVLGFGENTPPFDNTLPEERFYNRAVIIDIIPPKY
jgi:hypothetical protein